MLTWMRGKLAGKARFDQLSEQEILALAISAEEDDARIYRTYADHLRDSYPNSARVLLGMAEEEDEHRHRLFEAHQRRFGNTIPLIRREHVADFYDRKPVWLVKNMSPEQIRNEARAMEMTAGRFYERAAARTTDADTRKLLGDLAMAESGHVQTFGELERDHLDEGTKAVEAEDAHRQFLLTWVQPGLAGLMDGSVSTLAPIFAAAFATGQTWPTFLVGLAASIGAGISMGFTEAVSDDGRLSGRGSPLKRGFACGLMTTVGGLGHALPYLIPEFWTATTIAIILVFFELWAIAWIQNRYMDTPFFKAAVQVVLGGGLVLAAGILIGSS